MVHMLDGRLVSNWIVLDILFHFFDIDSMKTFGATCKRFKDIAVIELKVRALCMTDHFRKPWMWTFRFLEITNPAINPVPFWGPTFKCTYCEDMHFMKPNNEEAIVRREVLQQFPPELSQEGFPTLMRLMRPVNGI